MAAKIILRSLGRHPAAGVALTAQDLECQVERVALAAGIRAKSDERAIARILAAAKGLDLREALEAREWGAENPDALRLVLGL